ncbi:MAG TPA: cation diffusion facilitator family transporter [Dehalococcoidia bacterium]|nr:cation diffusion facilitator family transporter [Dehalococcoidia bacterium]
MMSRLRLPVPSDLASRAAVVSFLANSGLMALKLAAGIITGSVAVLSDGIDSAQDVIASAIAFLSVRFAMRPPDLSHPYGHGRAETLAAMIQSLLIGLGGVYITYRAITRIADPPASIGVDLGVGAMVITALVNLVVVRYVSYAARVTGSPAIESDARHLWTNVVQAAAILAGLGLVRLTGEVLFDPLTALGLALYLFWTAGHILWESLHDVMDVSLAEEDVRFVEDAIMRHSDRIAGYHRLRTRRSGQRPYIDVHIIQPANMTVAEAHAIADSIEAEICARWPDACVTIQTEPADGRFLGPMQSPESRGREGEVPRIGRRRAS